MLRALCHRINALAAVRDRQQHRRARQVLVEQVMMHDLIMPEATARRGVERQQTIGEQIVAVPCTTVEIRLRRLRRHVDDATLFIQRLTAPRHRARRRLVRRQPARFRDRNRPAAE
jgi:hypothetical protein